MAGDIAQWLEGLGLGQYAQAFAENSVELDHLSSTIAATLGTSSSMVSDPMIVTLGSSC